jgi:integrase
VGVTLQELARASRVIRDAVKDRSYQATPLGLKVARYTRWKKNEWGATLETMRDYERTLAWLALDHPLLDIEAFAPPAGTQLVRDFIDHRWGSKTPRTRAKNLSILRDFFAWCVREELLLGNPGLAIARPRRRGTVRSVFQPDIVEQIIGSAPRLRDRVALQFLFRLGLRKGELTRFQFAHYDAAGQSVTIIGKAGRVRSIPIADAYLVADLVEHIRRREPKPTEYLLYPEKRGPIFHARPDEAPVDVIWQDPTKPLSPTGMHYWWSRMLIQAGVAHRPMHEARHTAITALVRSSGNLKLAQLLAGHATIQTTADIYSHLDTADLRTALERLSQERDG